MIPRIRRRCTNLLVLVLAALVMVVLFSRSPFRLRRWFQVARFADVQSFDMTAIGDSAEQVVEEEDEDDNEDEGILIGNERHDGGESKKEMCETLRHANFVHVATAGDKNRLAAMVTLATSVILNTNSTVMWHFITFDSQVEQLRDVMESSIVRNSAYEIIPFSNDTLKGQFLVRSPRQELSNPMNFVRFYMPALLPCVDNVVYLDVDTLVVGDIKNLYTWPMKEGHVAALLPEAKKLASTALNFSHPLIQNLTIKEDTLIMSAGVIVANLTRWRARNVSGELDFWMRTNVRTPVVKYSLTGPGSQAMVLLGLYDKYTPLDPSWNILVKYQSEHEPERGSNLLHWSGTRKPWLTDEVKNAALWWKYFLRSNCTLSRPAA